MAPKYSRPETGLGTSFSDPYTSGPLAEAIDANRQWWLTFNSKALPLLQAKALANNRAFAAEFFVLEQAISRARIARADLFPSLGVGFSASRSGKDSTYGYSVSDSFSGNAQASYELDLWGKNLDASRTEAYTALAGLNAWRAAGLSLESEVALTYFSYLAARANLRVYDSMLEVAREVLDYQEKREALGAVAPLEVARQRASVHSMEAQRLGYIQRMTEAKNSLCQLIGETELPLELAKIMEEERLVEILPPPVAPGMPSTLLERRPDIAEAEARLLSANANIGVARAAFLPVISLTAQAGWQSDALNTLITPTSALYSLASSIITPIFEGGRLIAQHDSAVAAREELVRRYQEAALSAFWEVSTALSANVLLDGQEKQRFLASEQNNEAYRIARARYAAGAEDFLAVLDAQDAVLSSDSSMIQTRLERLNNSVTLFKALGGGWGEETPEEQPSNL